MSLHTCEIFFHKLSYQFNIVINSDFVKLHTALNCIIVTVFYFMPIEIGLLKVFICIHNSTMLILTFKPLCLEKVKIKRPEHQSMDLRFHASRSIVF